MWNKKRAKEGNKDFSTTVIVPITYENMGYEHNNNHGEELTHQVSTDSGSKSLRDIVVGKMGENQKEWENEISDEELEVDEEESKVRVEEIQVGGYDCSMFVLSKAEEKCILRPWMRVSLLSF